MFPNKLVDAWEIMKARNFSQIPVFDERDRAICSASESFLAAHVTLEYGLERRIDEVEVEDTFPMVGRNTAATTVADILKTKQAVLVVEKGKAIRGPRLGVPVPATCTSLIWQKFFINSS